MSAGGAVPSSASGLVELVRSLLKDKHAVWTIGPDDTVYDALTLMAEKQVGALVVVTEGKLTGIISERDYARKVVLVGKASKETYVSEIMTSPAVAVSPDETVDDCMRLMTQHRIRHLPVVEGDKLVGIVSIGDLVKAIISAQTDTIHQLHRYIAGDYLA